jgi:hypothetical protein
MDFFLAISWREQVSFGWDDDKFIGIIIIQWNRVLAGSKRVSIETGTTANAYNVYHDVNRTNNMVPPRTLAESALNDSLHSMSDSEWSVVSNSDNNDDYFYNTDIISFICYGKRKYILEVQIII